MTRKNRGVLGQDIPNEGFKSKVKDTVRTVTGKRGGSSGKVLTVIGKADRKGAGDEPERQAALMEKEGISSRQAAAQLEDKSLTPDAPGHGKRDYGIIKRR